MEVHAKFLGFLSREDPQAKAEFMEEWGLESGEMTDLQILRAIKNGQL
jgi:hypothetical protein